MADTVPRRRLLVASVPLVLLTAGCRSADLFAGPDPLGGRPPLAHDTVVLQSVIAAEHVLISRYKSAIGGQGSAQLATLLAALLAEHQQHLTQLTARLIVPPGAQPTPPGLATATGSATQAGSAASGATAAGAPSTAGSAAGSPATAGTAGAGSAAGQATGPQSASQLRNAEIASAASLTAQLVSVGPSLAQLFASIAASDATHAAALGGAR